MGGLSLASKITLLCIAATVAGLVVTLGLFEWQDVRADQAELVSSQTAYARGLAVAASQGEMERAQAIFDHDADAAAAVYTAADGRRVAFFHGAPARVSASPPVGATTGLARVQGVDIRVQVAADGRPAGELVLTASYDRVWRSLGRNLAAASLLALLGVSCSGIAAYFLVRGALRPLVDLDGAIGAVGKTKDFTTVVRPRAMDEIGRLTASFKACWKSSPATTATCTARWGI